MSAAAGSAASTPATGTGLFATPTSTSAGSFATGTTFNFSAPVSQAAASSQPTAANSGGFSFSASVSASSSSLQSSAPALFEIPASASASFSAALSQKPANAVTSQTPAGTSASTAAGFSFATVPTPQASSSASAPVASLFSNTSASTSTAAHSTSSAASGPVASLFGPSSGAGVTTVSLTSSSSAAAASFSSPVAAPSSTAGASSSVTTPASSAGFSFSTAPATTSALAASSSANFLTQPQSGNAVSAPTEAKKTSKESGTEALNLPSEIGNLSLDEVVNKWTEDVSELSEQFEKAAALVSKWDRAILANEDRIHALHKDAQTLQIAHKELSGNLDVILSQQSELHNLLDALEEDVERKLGAAKTKGDARATADSRSLVAAPAFPARGSHTPSHTTNGNPRVPGDAEREAMHRLTVDIMEELDAIALTVRDLVSELNKHQDGVSSNGGTDIVAQIIAVLNAHLDSLMYLDESSGTLQKRLTDVSRAVEVISRDSDRMFGGRRVDGRY